MARRSCILQAYRSAASSVPGGAGCQNGCRGGAGLSIPSADARRDARACYERQSWREARDLLLAADRELPLSAEDLDRLAVSSYMLGFESEGYDVWARAHHAFVAQGKVEGAAASAFRI